MATFHFTNLKDAMKAIRRDFRARQTRVKGAVRKAARQTRNYVARETVPRAFAELAGSIHVEDGKPGFSKVIADAPHAGAVENGSRPHRPPLEPLLAWVQLRGLQSITDTGMLRRTSSKSWSTISGKTQSAVASRHAARAIGEALKSRTGSKAGLTAWRRRALLGTLVRGAKISDPATVAVARAIQHKIAKVGTKPFKYMMQGIYPCIAFLDEYVRQALPDQEKAEPE
jgi:hypothetical protein